MDVKHCFDPYHRHVAGRITPLLLLLLTFALSAGDAFETPTWRAVLPELVTKEDLPSAAALNGIEFNFARAVGPALAGAVIALWGVGRAFLLNAVSFVGVIVVVARWKRAHRKRTVPVETLSGATIAALRFVRFAPALRAVILRSGVVMFFASGLLALLPSIARTAKNSPFGYGFLLGGFGLGAVLGAVAMQSMRKRWSTEQMLAASTVLFGITTMAAGVLRSLPMLGAVMLAGGAAWIVFLSLYNVAILNLSPDWVRARVAGVWMMVFQGAVAGGSATWGALATRSDIHHALLWAGAGTLVTVGLEYLSGPRISPSTSPRGTIGACQPSQALRRPIRRTLARFSSRWNTTSPRNEPPTSSRRCIDMDGSADAMALTNGESFATPGKKIVISRPSWCIPGRNTFASMLARFSRTVHWKSAYKAAREASPRSGILFPRNKGWSFHGAGEWARLRSVHWPRRILACQA